MSATIWCRKERNTQNYDLACCFLWCKTWSVRLKLKDRLRVFGNRVLREILGINKEELAGDWRQLQNEELHYL